MQQEPEKRLEVREALKHLEIAAEWLECTGESLSFVLVWQVINQLSLPVDLQLEPIR